MDVDPEHEESACARIRESFLNSCMCLDDHIDQLKEKMADKFLSANYNESLMAWLRICHDFQDLEVLRNHFSINKPMSKFTWLDWLRDKIREGAERSIIEELFERAVFDINTVELWLEYVAWSIQVDDSSHKYARSKFEAAITEVGLHCMEGHRIWVAYLQFETDLLNDDPENSMQIKRLKELYLRSFKVPIWGMKGLLSQYKKQFRGVSEDIEKQFKKTQKDLDDVLNCEISMTGNMYAIADIFAYLDVLLKIGDIPRARSLYERAVTRHPYNEDLWVAYGGWLEGLKIYAIASRVYQRSVRYLSENVALWQSCLLAMERSINQYGPLTGNEDEQDRKLSDTVEKLDALWECAKDSFQHENEGCSLYRTYGYLLRRRAVSSSDPPDYTKASEHFDYGYRYIQQKYGPKKWDHTFEYRMNFAYFCYTCLDDPAKGRFLWKDIMATGGAKHSNICIEAARAERQFGSIEQARKHLIRGLNSVTDDPSELFRFYIQFEREEGTLEQLDYALARVNSQYCMREERREKEEQKRKEEEQEEKKQKEETRKLLRAAKDSLMPAKTRGIIYVNEEESVGKPKKRAATAAPAQEFSPAKKFASIGNDDTPCSSGTLNASPAKDKDGFAMPMLPVRKQSPSPVSSGPSSPSSSSTSVNGPPAITVEQANTITKPKNEAATTPFTLFIFNIDFALDPKEIADVLGGVHAVRLGQGDGPKKSNGRGFVDFVSEEARLAALAKDGIHVSGRPLRICIDDKDNRPKFKYDTEGVDKRKLFARPIPMNTTKDELRELFGVHGEIEDIRIPEKSSGHQKGVAYIDFATEEAAVNALAAEIHFKGVKLETYVSRPPPPKKSGPPPPKELPPLPEGRKTSLQMVPRKVAVTRGGARGGSRGVARGGARGGARAPAASNGGAALSNDQFRKFLAGPK